MNKLFNTYTITVDQAIQNLLRNYTDNDLENIEWLSRKKRDSIINDYRTMYGWTIAECEKFLDNACMAYELLVKESAA